MDITICSSIDFTPKMKEVSDKLVAMGHTVNLPYTSQKIIDGELDYNEFIQQKEKSGDIVFRNKYKADMIKRYYKLIKSSDAILVLNYDKKGINNYIGGSVLMEMGFAHILEKKIYMFHNIPDMPYTDEIKDMKPIVISGELTKIVN